MEECMVIDDQISRRSKKRRRDDDDTEEEEELSMVQRLSRMTPERRLLLQNLIEFKREYGDVYNQTIELLKSEFAQLSDDELKNLLEVLETSSGISSPYDNATACIKLGGLVADATLGTQGSWASLLTNFKVIKSVHELLPNFIQNLGRHGDLISYMWEKIISPPIQKNTFFYPKHPQSSPKQAIVVANEPTKDLHKTNVSEKPITEGTKAQTVEEHPVTSSTSSNEAVNNRPTSLRKNKDNAKDNKKSR